MAKPSISIRERISGFGNEVILDHYNVQRPLSLVDAMVTGTAPTPVLTRAATKSFTLISTGDGTEVTYLAWQLPVDNFIKPERGIRIKSIRVLYTVATAVITDLQVSLASVALASDGQTVTAITGTYDAAHNTTAERLAEGNHDLLYTITTPVTISTSQAFPVIEIQLDTLNGAVTTLRGVIVTYDILTP